MIYDFSKAEVPVTIANNTNEDKMISLFPLNSIIVKAGESIIVKVKDSKELVELNSQLRELGLLDNNSSSSFDPIDISVGKKYSFSLKTNPDISKTISAFKIMSSEDNTREFPYPLYSIIGTDESENHIIIGNALIAGDLLPAGIAIQEGRSVKVISYINKEIADIVNSNEGNVSVEYNEDGYYTNNENSSFIKCEDSMLSKIKNVGIKVTRICGVRSFEDHTDSIESVNSDEISEVFDLIEEYKEPVTITVYEETLGKSSKARNELIRGIEFRRVLVSGGEKPYTIELQGKDADKLMIENKEFVTEV